MFSTLSDTTNIPGPSQAWSTQLDDDQLSTSHSIAHSTAHSTTSKRGHEKTNTNTNGPDVDGFYLVRKKTRPQKPPTGKKH